METWLQIAGQLIGEAASQGDKQKAAQGLADSFNRYGELGTPELERIKAETLGSPELGDVQADPSMVAAQRSALDRMQQVVDDGGSTLEDQAQMNATSNTLARRSQGANAGVMRDLAARGGASNGSALAAMLSNNQASAARAGEEGMTQAGQAKKNALNAMMGRGQLAGKMRGQGFEEQSQAARAKDAMRMYNAGARERANTYNNRTLPQQQWENKMRLLAAQTGRSDALVGMHNANAQDAREAGTMYGKAAAEGVKAYNSEYDGMGNDERYQDDMTGKRGGYTDLSKDDPDFK